MIHVPSRRNSLNLEDWRWNTPTRKFLKFPTNVDSTSSVSCEFRSWWLRIEWEPYGDCWAELWGRRRKLSLIQGRLPLFGAGPGRAERTERTDSPLVRWMSSSKQQQTNKQTNKRTNNKLLFSCLRNPNSNRMSTFLECNTLGNPTKFLAWHSPFLAWWM